MADFTIRVNLFPSAQHFRCYDTPRGSKNGLPIGAECIYTPPAFYANKNAVFRAPGRVVAAKVRRARQRVKTVTPLFVLPLFRILSRKPLLFSRVMNHEPFQKLVIKTFRENRRRNRLPDLDVLLHLRLVVLYGLPRVVFSFLRAAKNYKSNKLSSLKPRIITRLETKK